VHNQSHFDKCCTSKGKKQWKINARTFLDDQDCSHHQKWKKDDELKPRQFQSMRIVEAIIFLPSGPALLVKAMINISLFVLQPTFVCHELRNARTQFLVLFLTLKEMVETDSQILLLGFRQRYVFLDAELLKFDELVYRPLDVLRTVTNYALFFFPVANLPIQIGNLLLKCSSSLDQGLIHMPFSNRVVLWPFDGFDVLYEKAKEPENQDCEDDSE
jgi:hypothetical protein